MRRLHRAEAVADVAGEEVDLVPRPADREADDDGEERPQDVSPRSRQAALTAARPAARRDVTDRRRDTHAQSDDHARVAVSEEEDWYEQLETECGHAGDPPPGAARVELQTVTLAGHHAAGRQLERHVVDGTDKPGGRTHRHHVRATEAVAVEDGVDDGDIALERQRHQVVGG